MKRILTLILAVVMIMGVVPMTDVYAANDEDNSNYSDRYKEFGRTDVYALDYFSYTPDQYEYASLKYPEQYKVVQQITKGLTRDSDKLVAIADWLYKNMVYDWDFYHYRIRDKSGKLAAAGIPEWLTGVCEHYANNAVIMFRFAGLPAKKVTSSAKKYERGHAWNHVFLDGNWVDVDTTMGSSYGVVTPDYYDNLDFYFPKIYFDGTLKIMDKHTGDVIQTIGPLPIHAMKADIPEIASKTLYTDGGCTTPVDPKTWKFDSSNQTLFTDEVAQPCKIAFNVQLDNQYKSIVSHVVDTTDGNLYSFVSVPSSADFPQVKLPVKPGYTFIGWRDLNNDKGPIWNAGSGKVTEDMDLVAVFKKGTVNYTVKFNSNGGTAVKDATVKANTSIKKPANPTRTGYKFIGWYKDSKLTQTWNFTNPVTANTTLYAGWESTNNAKPTSSKVLVNGTAIEFDAYTINNNNYFKLRDLAQALNNTEKNFEVTWDGKKNAINLISNKPYTPAGGELSKGDGKAKAATLSTAKIFKDGKEISLTAYTINGNNYFKLRDIAKAFDIGITWDSKTNTVGIDTSISYVEE